MAYRNFGLEKLYANKTKDLNSLKTDDIYGARPRPRVHERMNINRRDGSPDWVQNANNIQLPGYNYIGNPAYLSDNKLIQYQQGLASSTLEDHYLHDKVQS